MSKSRSKWQRKQQTDFALMQSTPANTTPYHYAQVFKTCTHKAETAVFSIGDTHIFGGTAWDCRATLSQFDTVLDCADALTSDVLVLPERYEQLRKYTIDAMQRICIPWPDGGSPAVTFGFWPALLQLLPAGNVLACCIGGHGRTGTALAALLIVGKDIGADFAINMIRTRHCKQAIETARQITYLHCLANWWLENRATFDVGA